MVADDDVPRNIDALAGMHVEDRVGIVGAQLVPGSEHAILAYGHRRHFAGVDEAVGGAGDVVADDHAAALPDPHQPLEGVVPVVAAKLEVALGAVELKGQAVDARRRIYDHPVVGAAEQHLDARQGIRAMDAVAARILIVSCTFQGHCVLHGFTRGRGRVAPGVVTAC
ncbi:hypothetical protein D3C85_1368360 [compost metagenome]